MRVQSESRIHFEYQCGWLELENFVRWNSLKQVYEALDQVGCCYAVVDEVAVNVGVRFGEGSLLLVSDETDLCHPQI